MKKEIAVINRVSLRYDGTMVLQNISATFCSHSFYFITGPSGAGKSSLLRLLYLGIKPTIGDIFLFNTNTLSIGRTDMYKFRQKIGIVFQDSNLINTLSVVDNVLLPLKICGKDPDSCRKSAISLLAWVGLEEYIDAFPPSLSGGEKQRVAIARAVISNPDLIVADEPTGNVDDEMAHRLLYLFDNLRESGTCVVLATHNNNLIKQFNHKVIRLSEGRIR